MTGVRSGPGLCQRCRELRSSIPRLDYIKLSAELRKGRETDPPSWKSLVLWQDVWTPCEALVEGVLRAMHGPEKVRDAMVRLGITYDLFRDVGVYAVGKDEYENWASVRKRERSSRVGLKAAETYRALSPEDRCRVLKRRFPRTRSRIEVAVAGFLSRACQSFVTNDWQALRIDGKWTPREADIKIDCGRSKIVVECDGEAWHGPKCIFGDWERNVEEDVKTSEAYFAAGYSIIRYSETEIKSGVAFAHLANAIARVREGERVFRSWYPPIERWSLLHEQPLTNEPKKA